MRAFTIASRWFALIALCVVLVFTFTFGGGIWIGVFIALFDHEHEPSWSLTDALLSAAMFSVVPVASAWLFGGIIGAKICSESRVSQTEALCRGALIGVFSGLTMYVVFEIDVFSWGYSSAIETSVERGRQVNQGVFSVVVPITAVIGALAARSLRLREKGR